MAVRRMVTRFGIALVIMTGVLVSYETTSAWELELVGLEGNVVAYAPMGWTPGGDYYDGTPVSFPIAIGPTVAECTSYNADQLGSARASAFVGYSGDSFMLSGQSEVWCSSPGSGANARAEISPVRIVLRLRRQPGDATLARIRVDYSAETTRDLSGEPEGWAAGVVRSQLTVVGVDSVVCTIESGAVAAVNDYVVLDDIEDGQVIAYAYGLEPSTIYASVANATFDAGRIYATARASFALGVANSPDVPIAVTGTTWGTLKTLYR